MIIMTLIGIIKDHFKSIKRLVMSLINEFNEFDDFDDFNDYLNNVNCH